MATPGQQGRIERRLAAILAADIAGYSRLMGADEAGTARALREIGPPSIRSWSVTAAGSSRRPGTACCWSFPPLLPRSSALHLGRTHRKPQIADQHGGTVKKSPA